MNVEKVWGVRYVSKNMLATSVDLVALAIRYASQKFVDWCHGVDFI
jgi:hypothetical protein